MTTLFSGVGAAMVTPFGADGGIDYKVLDKYIDWLISGGVSALLPFGTTGEPTTITAEEYETGLKHIIAYTNKRVPVIVGTGSNSTATACEHTRLAKKLGADGALVVTPYYNKCTQNGVVEHYKAVAACGLPVIMYNVPSRTGFNISPKTLYKLAKIKNIVGIKEASSNTDQVVDCAKACAELGLDMYSGDDGMTTAAMSMGARGVISVAASPAPKLMSELTRLCACNDYDKARKLQFKLNEYIHCLFCEVNPIPVKKAMQLIGIDVGAPRLPLTELEPEHTAMLEKSMRELGIL